MILQFTGLSGSGKTTISQNFALKYPEYKTKLIDGDQYRETISKDLGFSREDRIENISRLGFIADSVSWKYDLVIIAAINPFREARRELLQKYGARVVHVSCSIRECIDRDPKGLYKKALLPKGSPGRIERFTGISDFYEAPRDPAIKIDSSRFSVDECTLILKNSVDILIQKG